MFDRPLRADCGVLIRAVFVAQVCTGQPRAAIVVTVAGLVSVPPPISPVGVIWRDPGSSCGGGSGGGGGGSDLAMTLVADEQWGGGGFPLFRKRPLRGSNPYGSSELFSFHRRSRQSCQEPS